MVAGRPFRVGQQQRQPNTRGGAGQQASASYGRGGVSRGMGLTDDEPQPAGSFADGEDGGGGTAHTPFGSGYGGARPEGNGNDQPGVAGQLGKDFAKTVSGNGTLGDTLQPVANAYEGFGNDVGQKLGFGDRKQQELGQQGEDLANQQFDETSGVYGAMNDADKQYLGDVTGTHNAYEKQRDSAIGKYDEQLAGLSDQAAGQAADARKTYTGTIAPALKTAMSNATKEAGSAMTLKDAADPNNSVQQRYRDLYNKEGDQQGQAFSQEGAAAERMYNQTGSNVRGQYDQMGQGFRTQGLQDAGVMSALGAQATAGQFAGMPMGGAQLQAVNARNQAGASDAYAKGAQRMRDLKEQGLKFSSDMAKTGADANVSTRLLGEKRRADMRLGGIDTGRSESEAQYKRGEGARDRARQATGDVTDAEQNANAESRRFRGEIGDIGSERMGMETGRARDSMNLATDRANIAQGGRSGEQKRKLAGINQKYGYAQQRISDKIARENATQAGKVNALGSGVQSIATLFGGAMGGPGGAAIGNAGGGVAKGQMNDNAGNNYQYGGPSSGGSYDGMNDEPYYNQRRGYGR